MANSVGQYHVRQKNRMDSLDSAERTEKKKVLDVLSLTAALPASFLGCVRAYWIVVILNRITMARYVDPNSSMAQLFG
jgi:hypothetical protein